MGSAMLREAYKLMLRAMKIIREKKGKKAIRILAIGNAVADREIIVNKPMQDWVISLYSQGKGGGKINVDAVHPDKLGGNAPNLISTAGRLFPGGLCPMVLTLMTRAGPVVSKLVESTSEKLAHEGRTSFSYKLDCENAKDRQNTILEFPDSRDLVLSFKGDEKTRNWSWSEVSRIQGVREALECQTDIAFCKLTPITWQLIEAYKKGFLQYKGKKIRLKLGGTVYIDTSHNMARFEETKGEKLEVLLSALRAKGKREDNRDIILTLNDSEVCALASAMIYHMNKMPSSVKLRMEDPYESGKFLCDNLKINVVVHTSEYLLFFEAHNHSPACEPIVVPVFSFTPKIVTGAGDTFNGGLVVVEALRREAKKINPRFPMTREHTLLLASTITSVRLSRKDGRRPVLEELLKFMNSTPLKSIPKDLKKKLSKHQSTRLSAIMKK